MIRGFPTTGSRVALCAGKSSGPGFPGPRYRLAEDQGQFAIQFDTLARLRSQKLSSLAWKKKGEASTVTCTHVIWIAVDTALRMSWTAADPTSLVGRVAGRNDERNIWMTQPRVDD